MDPRPQNRPPGTYADPRPGKGRDAREEAAREQAVRDRTAREQAARADAARDSAADVESMAAADVEGTVGARPVESAAEAAGRARPGHPAESPRGFARFVTITAIVILAIIAWVVLF